MPYPILPVYIQQGAGEETILTLPYRALPEPDLSEAGYQCGVCNGMVPFHRIANFSAIRYT